MNRREFLKTGSAILGAAAVGEALRDPKEVKAAAIGRTGKIKITDVRTKMVAVPFARFGEFRPVTMWYMTRHASIHCITYIDTDAGVTGIGTQGDQQVIMNAIRPKLIGKDPFDIEKIENEEGRRIYNLRIAIVEPVFGNIRNNKRLDRFTLRGKIKVNIQWLLYCMVHNIEKIMNYGYGFA